MPDDIAQQLPLRVVRPDARPPVVEAPKLVGTRPVRYPSYDGRPMADSTEQERTMSYAGSALRTYFKRRENVLVAVDLLVYYQEGEPRARVAPDVMVVRGVHPRRRGSFRIWEEAEAPQFVLEVLPKGTHWKDHEDKRTTYAEIGVLEYFRFDPLGRSASLNGGWRLLGERLEGGKHRTLPQASDGSLHSKELGLDLRVRERGLDPLWRELRFRDPATGKDLPTHEDQDEMLVRKDEMLVREREMRMREREMRIKSEQRVLDLEAQLRELRDRPG